MYTERRQYSWDYEFFNTVKPKDNIATAIIVKSGTHQYSIRYGNFNNNSDDFCCSSKYTQCANVFLIVGRGERPSVLNLPSGNDDGSQADISRKDAGESTVIHTSKILYTIDIYVCSMVKVLQKGFAKPQ